MSLVQTPHQYPQYPQYPQIPTPQIPTPQFPKIPNYGTQHFPPVNINIPVWTPPVLALPPVIIPKLPEIVLPKPPTINIPNFQIPNFRFPMSTSQLSTHQQSQDTLIHQRQSFLQFSTTHLDSYLTLIPDNALPENMLFKSENKSKSNLITKS